MITRKEFLKLGAAAGSALAISSQLKFVQHARASQGAPLPASSIPKWVDPLPLLSVAGGPMETIVAGADEIVLTMKEFQSMMLPATFVPASGTYTGTWVWGYRAGQMPDTPAGTYIGPVIVSTRNQPTQVRYINHLTCNYIAWCDWTDQSLHWADPRGEGMIEGNPVHYDGPVPAVPHLHGGIVPPVLDGGPDGWCTADGAYKGNGYYTHAAAPAAGNECVYRYPNCQEAAPIWFHDHLMGGTRLNVYAGLAGAWPIIDPNMPLPAGLHPVGLQQGASGRVDFVVPMVIQDRMFDVNGQLYFPNQGINPEHEYWEPEFCGDTIVVNGKTWPYLSVEPRRYRFLFINGSNARTYELFLVGNGRKGKAPALWQIGTDQGYLDYPVKIGGKGGKKSLKLLRLMPGERADVIIDFAGFQGQTLVLNNTANTPWPSGDAPDRANLGQIVQFRVGASAAPDLSYNPAKATRLRPPMVRLVNPAKGTLAAGVVVNKTRQLTLNEIEAEPTTVNGVPYEGGPLEVLVNNTGYEGLEEGGIVRADFTPITIGGVTNYYSELPQEGDTEVWEIVNMTADAHPIHTHLTQFQLINRQNFNVDRYSAAYAAAFPGGVFKPAFGPPLDYAAGNPRALGGNPDVTPFLHGKPMAPFANEAGWKDTIQAQPGQVTRLAIRFAPGDKPLNDPDLSYPFDPFAAGHGYVWHCHIVDHEDNEMMRPYAVAPKSGVTRTYVQGVDY